MIEFSSNFPIYIQVADIIKKQIASNKLKCGDKLLSVRDMSTKLKVNPNTIQRAYQELDRDKITITQRGIGTFVNDNKDRIDKLRYDMASNAVDNFLNEMKDLGFNKEEIKEIVLGKI